MKRLSGLAAVFGLLVFIALSVGVAQDRVTLKTTAGSGRITLKCEIVDYIAGQLSLRLEPGLPVRNYPQDEIVKIETWRSETHDEGLKLLRDRNFKEARETLEKALRQESRIWMRRNLLASLTRASLNAGDYLSAGNYFSILTTSDPKTHHYNIAPLLWMNETVSPQLRQEARRWQMSDEQGPQLVGSSVLLFDKEYREKAETTLRNLGVSTSESVRALAKAQLWRMRIPAGIKTAEIQHWERDVSRMPKSVRGGPHFTLGRGWQSAGNSVRAAESFLQLPLVYPENRRLAAKAEFLAAQSLISTGQYTEAMTLLTEVIKRFDETPASQNAMSELKRLAGDSSDQSSNTRDGQNAP